MFVEMLIGNPCSPDVTVSDLPMFWESLQFLFPDHDQLSLSLDILGTPSINDFYAFSPPRSREYIRAPPFRKGKDLFHGANELVRLG